MDKIKVILVDDHQIILDGITSMLSNSNFSVEAEFNNGQQAINYLDSNPDIDLVVTDISMPLLNGIDLCKMLKAKNKEIKVVMLSMYNNSTAIKEALHAEADGFILKSADKKEFLTALHKIINSGTYFSQDILPLLYGQFQKEKQQSSELSDLTEREKEILVLISKEFTSEEIAEKLFISKKTVDNHRTNMLDKTKSKSTIGLVKFAIRNGLISA